MIKQEAAHPVDPAAAQRAANAANVRLRQALHVDFLMASDGGGIFLVGWVDDSQSELREIRIEIRDWSATLAPEDLARVRRTDVEAALGGVRTHPYGLWAVTFADVALESDLACKVSASLRNGAMFTASVPLRCCTEAQLRGTVSSYLGEGQPGHRTEPQHGQALEQLMREQRNRLVALPLRQAAEAVLPRHVIELVALSDSGGLMVSGWIDDRAAPLECVRVVGPEWKLSFGHDALGRACRDDVQRELGSPDRHPFSFWGFAASERALAAGATVGVEIQAGAAISGRAAAPVRRMSDAELRNAALSQLGSSLYRGNRTAEAMAVLDGFMGEQIIAHNLRISRAAASNPYVERFGRARRGKPKGSILVCLFGKPEFLFLQAALFAGRKGIEDYEFVYVCNSPELAERLLSEARTAAQVYDVALTLVLLPGNAGFGAANNLGVAHCSSDRILITNPDVFPRHPDWAARHTAIVEGRPAAETRLFGAPLYYDDGSLMHGGMYLESDTAVTVGAGGFTARRMLRVEHYGKGAPPGTEAFTRARPVPAITGAFMSCGRDWFESLGGFTEDYVFGHYEDADLCLKSLARGTPAWLHDIRLWHLEGKGSSPVTAHEGALIVNRWLFSRRWADMMAGGMLGACPAHPLLHTAPAAEKGLGQAIAVPEAVRFQPPVARARRTSAQAVPAIAAPARRNGRAGPAQAGH